MNGRVVAAAACLVADAALGYAVGAGSEAPALGAIFAVGAAVGLASGLYDTALAAAGRTPDGLRLGGLLLVPGLVVAVVAGRLAGPEVVTLSVDSVLLAGIAAGFVSVLLSGAGQAVAARVRRLVSS